jgi:ATP-dependent DNA helicase RecG
MTEAELRIIVAECESDRIEFTTSVNKTDKFAEAICAFANDLPGYSKPGYLMIGVQDDRKIVGVTVDDALLLNLAGLRAHGNIQPLPSITVEKVPTSDGDVAVVIVQPSQLPPVRYRGRVCIRLGPRRDFGTEQDERVLTEKRISHALTFDAEPSLDSTLADLDLRIFTIDYQPRVVDAEVIAENNRSIELQLSSLRFFDLKKSCPTNSGVILFAKDVKYWLPGAYIQFLRIAGTSLADDIVQDRVVVGDLLTVLRELDALIDANILQSPAPDTLLRERMTSQYPPAAVREILMNAIMHRDYKSTSPLRINWFNDRIEIQNPGGLYGAATAANFPNQTSYRNPVIAEALRALGYVNRYGRGVIRAKELLKNNGNPEPEFLFDQHSVLATIHGTK